jgi:solute carrier family 8 (sodium/calcium exchanger)
VFKVPVGSLGFSVTVFCIESLIAVLILFIRRRSAKVGAELGGPRNIKILSAAIFVFLWFIFVSLSALEAYGVITSNF